MLSSNDVSQMFAQQQSMFMGQNQFAQQIGISNPNMSLAAFGTDPRQKAFGRQGTFGGHAPISYASTGMNSSGYGTGNAMASGAVSALGGIASGASMLALDPITAGLYGSGMMSGGGMMGGAIRGMGAMAGGGLMGGMAVAAPMMMGAYAAQKYIGAGVEGAQQQMGIQNQLGSFGFANTSSRTGQGFTRDDAQQIGNQVRAIAHIPEMMTSVEELTKLIPKLKSSGMMAGVRDAAEFNSRFKEAVKTLRDVSRVMGTTMEEASQFFEHSRSVGYLGRTDQIKNAMNVQFTAAQTGMSTGQVMQLQQGGAQMAVGRGIRRQVGATAVTNMAQQFGRGMQSGAISQSDLEDMTGATGEAAVGAAAQQMTEKLARFAESTSAGKASMMGLADFDEKGRFKGINKELAQRYASGDVSKEELMKRLASFTSQQKISASRKVGSMAIEFAGATGPGGAMSFMTNVLAEGGHRGEAAKFMMQKYGFSEVDVDIMSQMQGMGMAGGDEDRQKKAFERKRRLEADIADRTDPSKIMSRLGTKLKSGLGITATEQWGSKIATSIGSAYDEFVDDVVGRYSVGLSEKGAQRLLQSFQSQKGKEDLKALFSMKLPPVPSGGVGRSIGDMLGGKTWFTEGAGNVTEQVKYVQKSLGFGGGIGGADTAGKVNDRLQQLGALGENAYAAKGQVQSIINKLNRTGAFSEADQATKMKMLSEQIGIEAAYGSGESVSEIQKFIKDKGLGKGGADKWSEAAAALSESVRNGFQDDEARMRELSKKHARSVTDASSYVKTVFGGATGIGVSNAVAADMQVGMNLMNALQNPRVEAVLQKEGISAEEGARQLEKALGKTPGSISEDEFKRTQEQHRQISADLADLPESERVKKRQEMIGALGVMAQAVVGKDIGVTQVAARDLMAGMGEGELKTALKSFSEAEGGAAASQVGKVQEVIEKQTAKFTAAQNELKEAYRSKDKNRIAAAEEKVAGIKKELGREIEGRIKTASSQFDRNAGDVAGKTYKSSAEAAAALGVTEDTLKQAGVGGEGGVTLTKDVVAKIKQKAVGATVAGGALVGTEAQAAKAAQDKLGKTLDSIDTTMKDVKKSIDLNTTSLTVANKLPGYKKAQESLALAEEQKEATK